MRNPQNFFRLIITVFAVSAWSNHCLAHDSLTAAQMVPAETMALIEITNLNTLCEKFKQTSIYSLYASPEMRPFVEPTEKNLLTKMDEIVKDLWKELGVENMPADLPIPQGRVGLAVFVNPRDFQVPDYSKVDHDDMTPEDWENLDPDTLPTRTQRGPDFQVIFFAKMGDKLAEAKKLAKIIETKNVDDGLLRQRETVRGVQVTVLKDEADTDVNFDTFCYGFKGDMLIVGSSLDYIQEFLVRQEKSDRPTLAQNASYKAVSAKLGDADLQFFLNTPLIIKLVNELAEEADRAKTLKAIDDLGFSNLGGIGYHVQISPNANEDFRVGGLLGVQGEKKGIPALLSPITKPIDFNRLVAKNSAMFLVANYDVAKIYDKTLEMIFAISGMNPTPMLDGMLGMTGDPATGRPPVKLRQDILGQLTPAITFVNRVEKPYDSAGSIKMLLAIGVSDGQVLSDALQRIHSTFLAQGNKDLQRELLGSQIFIIPGSEEFTKALLASRGVEVEDASVLQVGFAIAGDQLVLGTVDQVEQSIRDLGRKSLEGMKTDSMYQHVSRYFPDQVGIAAYENAQITAEREWWLMKEAARKAATEPSEDSDDSAYDLGQKLGYGLATGESPLQVLVEALSPYVDFTTLPDFANVKKYFGASIMYVKDVPEGIYMSGAVLKAPSQTP